MAETSKGIRKKKESQSVRRIRIARRSMTYIVRLLMLVTVGAIICIAAFMTAERVSNLYILTTEGMSMRAGCMIKGNEQNDLQEYFSLTFLDRDTALSEKRYADYTITGYDYDLSVERLSVLPWSMTATVTVVERVALRGYINSDLLSEGESAADFPLPRWTPVRYKIHFVNDGTRWYITELELVEENPDVGALNTPDPAMSPRPMATPTPTPTPTGRPA